MKKALFVLAIISIFLSQISISQNILYVDLGATGNNDGTSWSNAYIDLQKALEVAVEKEEIWVAQGTYYPTNSLDRTMSFVVKSGVSIYGGFKGIETAKSERSKERSNSILSGDIGQQQNPNDNSYSVVFCKNTRKGTIVDGFQIIEGNADNTEDLPEHRYSSTNQGGGIYFKGNDTQNNSFLTVRNCFFRHNQAALYGGGIMIEGGNKEAASAKIINCIFEENFVQYKGGGAIAKLGDDDLEDWTLVDSCEFHGNLTPYRGAAIYFEGVGRQENISIRNSLFKRNGGNYLGGAIYHGGIDLHPHQSIDISNCSFTENWSKDGAGIYYTPFTQDNEVSINITGCTFENNVSYIRNWKPDDTGTSRPSGAAIFINPYRHYFHHSPLQLTNCFFKNNLSNQGGAIYSIQPIHAVNCIFESNQADDGGAIFIEGTVKANDFIFQNSTFYNNRATMEGGVLVFNGFYQGGGAEYHKVTFQNSIFWNNKAEVRGNNCLVANSINRLENCIIDVPDCMAAFLPDTAFFQYEDYFLDCGDQNLYNQYPIFKDTLNENLSLASCSPAINAGNNNLLLTIDEDILGNPRIIDGQIDIGAIESPNEDTTVIEAIICDGEVFNLFNSEFTQSGTYHATMSSPERCDSIVELKLTVFISEETTIDTLIKSGETIQIGAFTFDEPGTYFIHLDGNNGCDSLIRFTLDFSTGVIDFSNSYQMELFPNPTKLPTSQLKIFSPTNEIISISIFDYAGHFINEQKTKLLQGKTTLLELKLPDKSGIYLIQVINSKGQVNYLKGIKL